MIRQEEDEEDDNDTSTADGSSANSKTIGPAAPQGALAKVAICSLVSSLCIAFPLTSPSYQVDSIKTRVSPLLSPLLQAAARNAAKRAKQKKVKAEGDPLTTPAWAEKVFPIDFTPAWAEKVFPFRVHSCLGREGVPF